MQGTQEHDGMARATACHREKGEKKRPGLELGGRGKGDVAGGLRFPCPRKHL